MGGGWLGREVGAVECLPKGKHVTSFRVVHADLSCTSSASEAKPERQQLYHWGQNDYLPNFYSRRIVLGNCMFFFTLPQKESGKRSLAKKRRKK